MIFHIEAKTTTAPPVCHKCGNNRQVWVNQITGLLTCHRLGCDTVVKTHQEAGQSTHGDRAVPIALRTQ